MTRTAKPIPDRYHSLTPSIVVRGASKALEFYKQAFGAKELERSVGPEGKVLHSELQIGDSMLVVSDEFDFGARSPESLQGVTASLMLYVENVDQVFDQAVKAGAKVIMPVENMFWGDRYGMVQDPFGHHWGLATHIEDLTREQIQERQKAFFARMAGDGLRSREE